MYAANGRLSLASSTAILYCPVPSDLPTCSIFCRAAEGLSVVGTCASPQRQFNLCGNCIYQQMYLKLFNKITDVIEELQQIQEEVEELYIKGSEPDLTALKPQKKERAEK